MRRARWVLLLLLAASAARADGIPTRQRALLILRVLAYDRALPVRAGQAVQIVVVHRPGSPRSRSEGEDLVSALNELARTVVVAGLPVRATSVPWQGDADLTGRLAALRPAALYACAGLLDVAPELEAMARRGRALTFAGEAAYVERGFAAALVPRGERASLLVAPAVAAAEGAELEAAILALAEHFPPRRPPPEVRGPAAPSGAR